jgi:type 1 fimbria pilin
MATASVGLYKDGILLGTGTADTANNTITSYSGTAPINGRNIQIQNRATTNLGRSYNVRVLSGSGTATLTLNAPFPYA